MKWEIKERVEKIRKGEVPEGYKKTKVGIIPDDWDFKKLGTLSEFFKGKGLSKDEIIINGKYKCIHYGELFRQYGEEITEILSCTDKVDNIFTSNNNDVLMPTSDITPDGLATASCIKEKGVILGGDILIIRVSELLLNGTYLSYTICHEKKQIMRLISGITVFHLYGNNMSQFKLRLPKINEQKKIAEILSTWDKAIELKEKLIDEKKELRNAIVNDSIFGLKRFDEFIISHKYNRTKYINTPEDWDFIKISDIATEVSEKNRNHDKLPVLSCTKYAGLVDSLKYFKKRVFSEDLSTYKQVKKNHFVYATNHIDEGSIGYQNLYENSVVSPMYTVFKTNSKVNNHFLFNLLKTRLYIFIYQVNMSASVDRRGSLRWNEFSKIRIPLPSIAEQNKIIELINSVDENIELLKLELNQLKEQKRGLMQLLLTGIVRVEVD